MEKDDAPVSHIHPVLLKDSALSRMDITNAPSCKREE